MTTTTNKTRMHKMKKIYRTVVTVPNRHIVDTKEKSRNLTNICMTSHFPDLVQALQ